jgi:hypothetical protein
MPEKRSSPRTGMSEALAVVPASRVLDAAPAGIAENTDSHRAGLGRELLAHADQDPNRLLKDARVSFRQVHDLFKDSDTSSNAPTLIFSTSI